ncbi:glutamate receptor 1-like [Lytechinus pictus]|uniref:glutamate receptor 1-like n=1 Tax=Lytechinus pictus TaxID=7653 RepID=UPI00240E100A|nr:glutamate receptor 1-like [Lytechinus pictus]
MEKTLFFTVGILFLQQAFAAEISIGSFYGVMTDKDDEYKRIIDDAVDYVTRQAWSNQNTLRVTHFQPEMNALGEPEISTNIFQAVQIEVCAHARSSSLRGIVLPHDICMDCNDISGVIGDAINPTVAIDLAGGDYSVKLYPDVGDLVDLFAEVINYTKWRDFLLIYDGDNAQGIVEEMTAQANDRNQTIKVLPIPEDLTELHTTLAGSSIKNILLFCQYEEICLDVVKMAIDENLMIDGYHWFLGNLDLPLTWEEVSQIRLDGAYITRLQMNKQSNVNVRYTTTRPENQEEWPFRLKMAYDAVVLLGEAFESHLQRLGTFPTKVAQCPTASESFQLSSVMQDIKEVNFEGLSGHISFDNMYRRTNYSITIHQGKGQTVYFYTDNQYRAAGEWVQSISLWRQANRGMSWPNPGSRLNMYEFRNAELKSIIVTSLEEAPYLIDSGQGFIGYVPELLRNIKIVMENELGLPFDYEIELVGEGEYGRLDATTGRWSGLMEKLVEGYADIAAAPMAITSERDKYIDYTVPFMRSELGILIEHPSYVWEHPFVPVFPYDWNVWICNFAALFVSGVFLFLICYFSPYEWRAKSKRGEASSEQGESFKFSNTAWYMITTMYLQSYDVSPRSVAGRVLSAFWYLFMLVMVFLYLINLTPFLRASKGIIQVRDVGDLFDQTTVDVGFVKDSSAYDFFRDNRIPEYRRLWETVQSAVSMYRDDSGIVLEVEDGVLRTRHSNGKYAFIHDRRVLQHGSRQWPCNLVITGGSFATVEYGLAVASGSPLRDQLSWCIERLEERGTLESLWNNNTWVDPQRRGPCNNERMTYWERQALYSLTAVDLQGMYYLMIIGMGSAVIIFALEVLAFQLGVGTNAPRVSRNDAREMRIVQASSGGGVGGGMGGGGGGGGASGGANDGKMWI